MPLPNAPTVAVECLKVTEFIDCMCGRKVGSQPLTNHSVVLTGPQVVGTGLTASGTDVATFTLENSIESLAITIQEGKSKIGSWDRLVARIKSWLPGRDMSTEIAKQAFGKIDKHSQLVILKLAFYCAASPWSLKNVSASVQNLLKFCPDANDIIDVIDSMPDSAGKTKVLAALGQHNSGFNGGRLGANATKKFVLALARASRDAIVSKPSSGSSRQQTRDPDLYMAGRQCTNHLRRLIYDDNNLDDLVNMEVDTVKGFILDLLKAGGFYGGCLDKLVRNDRLGHINNAAFEEFALALGKSRNGGNCFQLLCNNNVLDPTPTFENVDMANRIALALSETVPEGVRCLEYLLTKGMNLNPDADMSKKLAINLAKYGNGGNCFQLLFEKGYFNSLNLDADCIADLAKAGSYGIEYLKRLLASNPPRFEGAAAIQLVRRLLGLRYGYSTDCLRLLIEKNLLTPTFKNADRAIAFALDPIETGGQGQWATCVRLLFEKNILNPNILNLEDAGTAKRFVIGLSKAGLDGAYWVWQLLKDGHLNSLNLEDADTAIAFALALSMAGENESKSAAHLKQSLEREELRSLHLDGDAANDFILALFCLEENGTDCLRLALEKGYLGNLNLNECFVYSLVDQFERGNKNGVACIRLLLDEHKLDSLPAFEYDTVKDLRLCLESASTHFTWEEREEKECLDRLYEKIQSKY
jgi:hypothetical protein